MDIEAIRKKWPELPERPTGWTEQMSMHMNFGRAGGAATLKIFDPDKVEMPITRQYDTRKGGINGFSIVGVVDQQPMRWSALRAAWREWIAK